jgi:hypothetical protein
VNSTSGLMWSNVITGIAIGILAVWATGGKTMGQS